MLCSDWGSKKAANAAARVQQTLALLMGSVSLEFSDVSPETLAFLSSSFFIDEEYKKDFHCDLNGEYSADGSFDEKQVQITRLMDCVR